MDRSTIVQQFATLFRGRLDAYGTEEGGCVRVPGGTWEEYLRRVEDHLFGDTPMGVYPLLDDGTVYWGCVDFDEGEEESWVHAVNLWRALDSMPVYVAGHIERSRSKGYHVWVFAKEPVPAVLMRRALMACCQIVGAPTREVNPKQTEVVGDEVGNYVRLPYPRDATHRRVMVGSDREPHHHDLWLIRARHDRATAEDLQTLADLYVPPAPTVTRHIPDGPAGDIEKILTKVDHKSLRMLFDPVGQLDRSRQLFVLGKRLADEERLNRSEIEAVLWYADEKWGSKYGSRRDGAQRIAEVMGKLGR